jgi:AcrR family transcriptional regulator
MTLAEKMETRRQSILRAAEVLIRQSGSTEFSMQELARTAGFSTATTYNLIGGKSVVLYSLLNLSVERLAMEADVAGSDSSLFQSVVRSAAKSVSFFASDPVFYKPLMRFLLGVPDPVQRPIFMARAYEFWRSLTGRLAAGHKFPSGVDSDEIARAMHISFTGALNLWVHDEMETHQFSAQMTKTLCLLLIGFDECLDKEIELMMLE